MVKRNKGGVIVNMSSAASLQVLQNHAVYCSTKAAVDKLTQVMALELGQHKVHVHFYLILYFRYDIPYYNI